MIVNDRADIARLSGADGVHVGQDDLAPALVRRLVASRGDRRSVDTHAGTGGCGGSAQPVNYVAIGPVFGTPTKATGNASARTRGGSGRAAARRAGLPLVAIGGITLETRTGCHRARRHSVAVISDLVVAAIRAARVRAYLEHLTL